MPESADILQGVHLPQLTTLDQQKAVDGSALRALIRHGLKEDANDLVAGSEVEAVDSMAAGDVFNGALAVASGEGMAPIDPEWFANVTGALSGTKLGVQPPAPAQKEK